MSLLLDLWAKCRLTFTCISQELVRIWCAVAEATSTSTSTTTTTTTTTSTAPHQHPPLSPDELGSIVLGYMPMIHHIAAKFKSFYEVGDLVGQGIIGCIKAAHEFQSQHGTRLSHEYAYRSIRNSMIDFMRQERCEALLQEYCDDTGYIPTDEELSRLKHLHLDTLRRTLLEEISTRLLPQEQLAIIYAYGLHGYGECTISEVASKLKVCHTRAKFRVDNALKKLRRSDKLRQLMEDLD